MARTTRKKKATKKAPARRASIPKEWPAAKVETRATSSLVPYARNARTHSDEQVRQIAASIREWGWTNPVLVDEENGIIAGHGRVLAAELLEIAKVPTMVARGWSESQRRAYVIADNKLAENAGWDEDILRIELTELEGLAELDLSLTGFDESEIRPLVDEPLFAPTEGGIRLDETEPIVCPECGHTWRK